MSINCPAATEADSDRRFTHPLSQVVLISIILIAVSIACTANTSVPSQPIAKATTEPQPTAQVSSTASQDKVPCTLTLAGSPTINGLRLGMTSDEVLALFPGIKQDAEVQDSLSRPPSTLGVSSFVVRPSRYESKDKFPGITQISFTLLDGRVYSISIGYKGPEYSHVDKFVEKFVEGKTLPSVDQWEPYVGMDNTLKVLKCSEFEANVFIGGAGGNLNYVLLKDLVADKKLRDRRAKARAQASPTP
jgi:hypothetical protein